MNELKTDRREYFRTYNARPERKIATRLSRDRHRERTNARIRESRSRNKEYWRQYWKDYRKAHPYIYQKYYQTVKEKRSLQYKEWAKKNPDVRRAIDRKWRAAHPDKMKKQHENWRARHLDAVKQRDREYALKNKETIRARNHEYHKRRYASDIEYREAFFRRSHERRLLKESQRKNPSLIKQYFKSVKSKPFAVCYYCRKHVSTKHIHFDHMMPLSKGGSHSVENLCVSCKDCNLSKHNKIIKDWINLGQQLLEL